MRCAVLKRGPLTEWWTLLLSRASDLRLIRNLDCFHHCRNRFDNGCIPHFVLFLEGVVELQRKNRCFDAGLVSFGAAWPTTIRLWYCCEKHFHSLDRSAVIGLITALAAARLGLSSADHDLRLGYEPINLIQVRLESNQYSAALSWGPASVAAKKKTRTWTFFFTNRQKLPDTFHLEMRKKKMKSTCSFLLYEQNWLLPSLTQIPNTPNKAITNNPVQDKTVAFFHSMLEHPVL